MLCASYDPKVGVRVEGDTAGFRLLAAALRGQHGPAYAIQLQEDAAVMVNGIPLRNLCVDRLEKPQPLHVSVLGTRLGIQGWGIHLDMVANQWVAPLIDNEPVVSAHLDWHPGHDEFISRESASVVFALNQRSLPPSATDSAEGSRTGVPQPE